MTRFRIAIVAFAFLALLHTHSADAARRRPAKILGVSLSGLILDANDSAPVFGAFIKIQGKAFAAGSDGRFEATGLEPGPTTVTFERWGYEASTQEVVLQAGTNTLDVRLTPRPVIQLTDDTGTAYRVDYDSAFFATQPPFSSLVPLSPAEFCRQQDGVVVTFTKEALARITGSGQSTEGGVCCPQGGPGALVTVTPRGGAPFDAVMQECRFYEYDFVARDRGTGNWLYLAFTRIRDIRFPE